MKRKIWANLLMGAVFAFVLSVSAVGNLVTGYDLEVKSLLVLFLWCAYCSLISALLFRFKYAGAVLLCLTVLAAPVIWKDGLLWEELQSLCYLISSHYHDVYDWSVIGKPLSDVVSRPLIVLSAWAAFSVSWSVCRRKHIMIIMPSLILPLVICLITTDRVPDTIYLYLLILGMALLLVTGWTRRNYPAQGIKLTFRLTIPIAAALALLFAANPRDEYVNNAGKYQKEVMSWFQKLQDTTEYISSGVSFESAVSEKLNLRNVGPRSPVPHSVMRVNSPIDGTIYLRGRDYDKYSGTGWESSLNRNEVFTSGTTSSGELIIVTYGVKDLLYVPYYSSNEITLVNGAVDNDENLQRYSYDLARSTSGGSDMPEASYTELPAETLQWTSNLDVIIDLEDLPQSEKIYRIESYVQNSAIYDLSTSRMSSEYHDFAQWFLEESDTGYCVHFATAATVLLRAAGIPARYVEGYMVACTAVEDVVVSSLDAHAWAEYYDSVSGTWKILEATPADLQDEEENVTTMSSISEGTEHDATVTEADASEPEQNDSGVAATIPDVETETQQITQDNMPDNMAGTTENKEPFKLPEWVKTIFWIILAMASIPIQSYVRIELKRKQWDQGKANEKAIVRWRQTKKLAHLVDVPFPEELELLAQKANFSQHRIQPCELQLFEDYKEDLLETVSSKPWYHRILLRWIFAIGS